MMYFSLTAILSRCRSNAILTTWHIPICVKSLTNKTQSQFCFWKRKDQSVEQNARTIQFKTQGLGSSDCLKLGKGLLRDVRAVGFNVVVKLAETHHGHACTKHFTQNSVVVLQLVVLQLVVLCVVMLVVSPEYRQPFALFCSSNPLLKYQNPNLTLN